MKGLSHCRCIWQLLYEAELETTVEEIKPIYDAVVKYLLDTEPKDIIERL